MTTCAQSRVLLFSVAALLLVVRGGRAEPVDPLVEKLIDDNAAAIGVFENVMYDVVQRDFSAAPEDPRITTAQVVRKDGNQFTRADMPLLVAGPGEMPRLGSWRVTSVENFDYAAYWANFVNAVYRMDKDELGQLSDHAVGLLRQRRPLDPQCFAGGDGEYTLVDYRIRFGDRVTWRADESPEGFVLSVETQPPGGGWPTLSECLLDKQTGLVARCRTFRAGRLVGEHRCSYEQIGEDRRWFPSKIEKYKPEGQDLKLALVIEITNVSFDVRDVQPDQFVWTALELDPHLAKVLYRSDQNDKAHSYWIEDGELILRELPHPDD